MKKPFYFLLMVMFLFTAFGCSVWYGSRQAKVTMDLGEQIHRSAFDVWNASLSAAEKLAIFIDDREFDGKKGLVSGHTNRLGFVRIHIEHLEPELTIVGIQARTSSFPWSSKGFDLEFSKSILAQIMEELGES